MTVEGEEDPISGDEDEEVTLDKGNFEELMIAMMKNIKSDLKEIKENQED